MIPYGRHYIDEDDIQSVVNTLRSGFLTQVLQSISLKLPLHIMLVLNMLWLFLSCTAGLHLHQLRQEWVQGIH